MSTKKPSKRRPPDFLMGAKQPVVAVSRTTTTEVRSHQGPLPAADEFRNYEEVLPGAADRILAMAEQQGAHRREMEALAHRGEVDWNSGILRIYSRNSLLGIVFAFLLGLTGLCGGIYLIALGKSVWGATAAIASLGGLLAVFFYGHRKKEQTGPPAPIP